MERFWQWSGERRGLVVLPFALGAEAGAEACDRGQDHVLLSVRNKLKAEEMEFSCTSWTPWKCLTALSFWNWKGSSSACGSAAKTRLFQWQFFLLSPDGHLICWWSVWSICRLEKISAASIWHQFSYLSARLLAKYFSLKSRMMLLVYSRIAIFQRQLFGG